MSCPFVPRGTYHEMVHVISDRCVACDLHTIVHGPLERTCWRRFAAQWGYCERSRIALLNAIIVIIIIIIIIFMAMFIMDLAFPLCMLRPTIKLSSFTVFNWCSMSLKISIDYDDDDLIL